MKRILLNFLIISILALSTSAEQPQEIFEAKIPKGKETDPVIIHQVARWKILNPGILRNVRNSYALYKQTPLSTRYGSVTLCTVAYKGKDHFPPDMGGVQPLRIFEFKSAYYVLIANNLARMFAPIPDEKWLHLYLKLYIREFFADWLRLQPGSKTGGKTKKSHPPVYPNLEKVKDGWKTRLIFEQGLHRDCTRAYDLHISKKTGKVTTLKKHILEDRGAGFMY